jgi:hypothetical protein
MREASVCTRDSQTPRLPTPRDTALACATAEQRLFQDFRKRLCTAYTGVVVHCQNMKLEARVNMVSYLPHRERKVSGGQVYIAYMTNPHQAAVVHDITASIMAAEGIPIYHSQNTRPTSNRGVVLERLNYLDDLSINSHRCALHFQCGMACPGQCTFIFCLVVILSDVCCCSLRTRKSS